MTPADAAAAPYSRRLRQLHLLIALLVTAIATCGFIFEYRKALGLGDQKILIMTIHVFIGYALILALSFRLSRFFGKQGESADAVLLRKADIRKLVGPGDSRQSRFKFAGRSPFSRMIATLLYLLLISNCVTGFLFASTELYHPPLGPAILKYVSADGAEPSIKEVRAGNFNKEHMQQVRRLKLPLAKVHYYGALAISAIALIHLFGAISTEWNRPGGGRGRARIMLFGPGMAK